MRRKWHMTAGVGVFDPDGALDVAGPKTVYGVGLDGYNSAHFDLAYPGDLVDDASARGCGLSRLPATARDESREICRTRSGAGVREVAEENRLLWSACCEHAVRAASPALLAKFEFICPG
jgi:hypothetical protein